MERIKALIPSEPKHQPRLFVDSHHCHFYFLPDTITRLAGIYLFKDWSKTSFHLFLDHPGSSVNGFRGIEFRPAFFVLWSGTVCESAPQWATRHRPHPPGRGTKRLPATSPPCPSGSCLLSSWITTTTTMAISPNGWAATGDTEQKLDKTGSENAVSGDLQKRIMTEGLHSQQWWEPAERNKNNILTTCLYKSILKTPPPHNWTTSNNDIGQSGQQIYCLCDLLHSC